MRVLLLALLLAVPALAALPAADAEEVGVEVCFTALPASCVGECLDLPSPVPLCVLATLPV